MYAGNSILAVIPARSGSKGLPGKNLMECAGRPLIEWSISSALSVDLIDKVVVSTDSKDIADHALNCGASVPFIRPTSLAGDDSSVVDVLAHAWENSTDSTGNRFDYVLLLQPTSPLRTSGHIENAILHFFQSDGGESATLASVYKADKKSGWLMQNDEITGRINFCFNVSKVNPQRQQLCQFYLPNGAIFFVKGVMIKTGLYGQNTIPFVMGEDESVDVDSLSDLMHAQAMLLRRSNSYY
jgi:CMP-N-acetylneuraminic acid synthetase